MGWCTEFTGGEFGDSSRTVGCVCVCGGESYIDEPLVGTVILPQIGELPVHLSIGEESSNRIVYAGRVSC